MASAPPAGIDRHLRSGPQMLQYQAIAERIAREQSGPVLDWGTGFGQVAKLLADQGVDVTPFEYRPDLPGGVRPLERYPELQAHSSADPVKLPFEDGSFDAVLSCGVLEHVQDPDGSVGELHRVLRPGGTFYLYNLPNRWGYTEKVARLLGLYYHGKLPDDRVYTLGSARALLERHGFEIRELRRAHMLPLVVGGPARMIWKTSCALERIPLLNLVATTVELVAVRHN
jgi:SAM-dependent methyltransferase